jgi:hypothetical protein
MNSPHPGLAAAVALAGSRRKLAEIIGKQHSYVNYRYKAGRGLPPDLAAVAGRKLGLSAAKLLDKKDRQ